MSTSVRNSISNSNPIILPKYKLAAKHALISSIAIAAFLLIAAAAVSLIVFSGFMFSIGVVPDGLYLLISGVALGAFAAYVAYKAYHRCLLTHNSIHHPEKLAIKK